MSEIIQFLWIGERLSTLENLVLTSFVKHDHEVHLYTYSEVKNIPNGVIVKDANEILDEKLIFTNYGGSVGAFSDWFRWKLLYERGGYWVDTDVVCVKKFDFKDEIVFSAENQTLASPGVLKFPKGHKIAKFLADNCEFPNKILAYDSTKIKLRKWVRKYLLGNKRSNVKFGEAAGPKGFTAAMKHHDLFNLAKPFTYFYPITGMNWATIFDESFASGISYFKDTYGIHLWNELLRRQNFDKDAKFPENSLYEQLKRKYLDE